MKFQKRRITEDQDLFVREGDFVRYGAIFYEIVKMLCKINDWKKLRMIENELKMLLKVKSKIKKTTKSKKKRTEKQKAATRKLVALNKRRAR